MPKSRKRNRKKVHGRPTAQKHAAADRRRTLEGMRPWLDTMVAVDDAERRGDAGEAARLISAHLRDPEGKLFWRSSRIDRLGQVLLLGAHLPRWAVSRWIVAQAHDFLGVPGSPRRRRCLDLAIEVRGGLEGLSRFGDDDARCKVIDHDWVYRQLFLYEHGGLRDFVRSWATPDLLSGADHIDDWIAAPITALRLVRVDPGAVIWERLDSGEHIETDNIGSASLVVLGEAVLGRIVPIEKGVMLEGAPLVVPHEAAELVAADPASWIDVVKRFRGDVETGGFEDGLTHDVQEMVWRAVLLEPDDEMPANSELATFLARRVLALARRCVSREWEPQPGDIDPWACLRAAFLDISVVARLRGVATAEDVATLERLAEVLAAPADVICRHLASELRAAA